MKCKLPVVDLVILSALTTNPVVHRSFFSFPEAWHNEGDEVQENTSIMSNRWGHVLSQLIQMGMVRDC